MQIPETPQTVQELDLMMRLIAYSGGDTSWYANNQEIGQGARQACATLHSDLVRLVDNVFDPILSRTTTREMEMFTMHDSTHARKVAHLMWHILDSERRERLTPPEIGLMVSAAYFHDLGMALSTEVRNNRLSPDSDLWDRLELEESQKYVIDSLYDAISNKNTTESDRIQATLQLHQTEEALLCLYVREMHATHNRYQELLNELATFHENDPSGIPDINTSLSFEGESFSKKLVEICEAHRGDAEGLLQTDGTGSGRTRYPRDYPIGSCNADLQLVAGSLRLADVLDFDRERTPIVLFHFLLPGTLGFEHRSVVEWKKHLSISNWQINQDAIIFRGRCDSHIIHHTIVQFCNVIADEISTVKSTFSALNGDDWPFVLPSIVKADIHEEGYRYIPYRFELDDERVYELFMGGSIYENPLAAVRELIQNSVDACKLRDNVTRLHESHLVPDKEHRITICYEEPTKDSPHPKLIVKDSGMGMDAFILERYFLKIGRSFYRSTEFKEIRFRLHQAEVDDLDFAPVSEFGIGFLSSFLLSDHVKIETSIWEPLHGGDTQLRMLWIDGPTRLIRLEERDNFGPGRFKGTKITLLLSRGSKHNTSIPPTWDEINNYLQHICLDLPYTLHLEHKTSDGKLILEIIVPTPLFVELPPHLEPFSTRIPVSDTESGLEGEIVIINSYMARKAEKELAEELPVELVKQNEVDPRCNPLIRGGFKISCIPGLPDSYQHHLSSGAMLRLDWRTFSGRNYPTPKLSRNGVVGEISIAHNVLRLWLSYLLDHVDNLPEGLLYHLSVRRSLEECEWLETYNAYTLYQLASQGWNVYFSKKDKQDNPIDTWEDGKGDSLYLGTFNYELHNGIFDLVLPSITSLQMGEQGRYYVKPPKSDWQSYFEGWHDFISSPIRWGPFVEYVKNIKDLFVYTYPGSHQLNSRHRERFEASFEQGESESLFKVLSKLCESRSYSWEQVKLTDSENEIYLRALDSLGDLEIGSIHGVWRIDDFRSSDVA